MVWVYKWFHQAPSGQWIHKFSVKWRTNEPCQQGVLLTGTRWCLTQSLWVMRHHVAFLILVWLPGSSAKVRQIIICYSWYYEDCMLLNLSCFFWTCLCLPLVLTISFLEEGWYFSVLGKGPDSADRPSHPLSPERQMLVLQTSEMLLSSPQGAVCSSQAVTSTTRPLIPSYSTAPSCLSAAAEPSCLHPN